MEVERGFFFFFFSFRVIGLDGLAREREAYSKAVLVVFGFLRDTWPVGFHPKWHVVMNPWFGFTDVEMIFDWDRGMGSEFGSHENGDCTREKFREPLRWVPLFKKNIQST